MPLSVILVALSLLLGFQISRRLLRPGASLGEAFTMAPLFATLLLIWGSKMWSPMEGRAWFAALLLFVNLALVPMSITRREAAPAADWAFSRRFTLLLGILLSLILCTVIYGHFHSVYHGNWIHDPLIAGYALGISAPVHPFFPWVPMDFQDGRDLLIGFLLPHGRDPLAVTFWLNPLLALSAAGVLCLTLQRGKARSGSILAGLAMPYFTICNTESPGWTDRFILIAAISILSLWLNSRILDLFDTPEERGDLIGLWVASGAVLGLSACVNASLFVLLSLTGVVLLVPAFIRSARKLRLALAIAVVTLVATACLLTVGGEALLLWVADAAVWMRGAGPFETLPRGLLFPPALPIILSPLSLLWLLYRKAWYGVPFWLFGGMAILVSPAIPFWESAAGFGLAVPLGLMCGDLITLPDSSSPEPVKFHQRALGGLAMIVLVLTLLPTILCAKKSIVGALSQTTKTEQTPGPWRVRQRQFGITAADIAVADALSSQILPGETVLTNLGDQTPEGFWPDYVLAVWTGALVRGRTYPDLPETFSGSSLSVSPPPYWRSELQRSLLAGNRLDLLWNSGIDWLVLDPAKTELSGRLETSGYARKAADHTDKAGAQRELWKISPPSTLQVARLPSQPPFRSRTLLESPDGLLPLHRVEHLAWNPGQIYRLRVSAANPGRKAARLGWLRLTLLDVQKNPVTEPLFYLLGANPLPPGTGDIHDIVFVTPLFPGHFQVHGDLMVRGGTTQLFSFPIYVSSVDSAGVAGAFTQIVLKQWTSVAPGKEGTGNVEWNTIAPRRNGVYELKSTISNKVRSV